MNKLSAPIYVGFDLTGRCNLRCIHCRVSTSSKNKELPLTLIKKTIDELAKMKVIQVIFSGGEPFIRKDIFKILSYALKSGIPDILIVSNGTLLNYNQIRKLKNTGIKKISLSLDGLKKNHDKIRGTGNFDKTVSTLKKLVKEGFEVKVSMTLNKMNKDDIPNFSRFLKKIGVSKINIGNLMPCGRGKTIWKQALTKNEKRKTIKKIRDLNNQLGDKFILFESSFLCEPKIGRSDKKIFSFFGCRGGRTSCAILSNGDVVACKMLPNIVAGNLQKKTLKKIWKDNKNWESWRNEIIIGKCKLCKYKKACRGGCKAISYFKYGNLNIPDPRCIGPFI